MLLRRRDTMLMPIVLGGPTAFARHSPRWRSTGVTRTSCLGPTRCTVALGILQSRARRLDRAGELDQQALAQRLEEAHRAARDVANNIAPPLPQDLLRRVLCTARDNSRANRVFSRSEV